MLDKSDKKQVEQLRREAILRQIEEDFQDRQQVQALKRQADAAESTPSWGLIITLGATEQGTSFQHAEVVISY